MIIHIKLIKKYLFYVTAILTFTKFAHAFMGTNETAEILPKGSYRIGVVPIFYIEKGGGTDYGAFLDINVSESINSRFEIGSGATDFWAAASAKWVPIPDVDNQPAMGLRGKFAISREKNVTFYNSQIAGILSKHYKTKNGEFIPYLGVPLTFIYEKSTNTFMASQFCLGSEWYISPDFQLGAEYALSMNNAINAISVYMNFQFNEKVGFKK